MDNWENVTFDTCEDLKCVESAVRLDPEGHLLLVPVYLKRVCPNRELVVGVEVYLDEKLYAIKTRKVFTGHHSCPKRIRKFYTGDFHFLLTNSCNKEICIKVLAHYIY